MNMLATQVFSTQSSQALAHDFTDSLKNVAARTLRPEKMVKMMPFFESLEEQSEHILQEWKKDLTTGVRCDYAYRIKELHGSYVAFEETFSHHTQNIQLNELFKDSFKRSMQLRWQNLMLSFLEPCQN